MILNVFNNKELVIKRFIIFLFIFFTNSYAYSGLVPWCDCHVTVQAVKEDGTQGGGTVFACYDKANQTTAKCTKALTTETILGKSHDYGKFPANVYLAAKPDAGWEFDYWECTLREGSYYPGIFKGTAVGTKLYTPLPNVQKACVSKMKGNPNNGDDGDVVTSSGDINAIWIAHFKRAEMQTVIVVSENPSLGTANIDKVTNYIDDEVTLTAWCGNANNNPRCESIMFQGWYRLNETTGEKEFVTKTNPYKFIITEANKGTYYARFASGYSFWRIKNNKFGDYLTAVAKYTGPVSTSYVETALNTQMSFNDDLESSITDVGTMFKFFITYQENTHDEIWDYYVQNDHTNVYYDATRGVGIFLQVTHQSDNTYLLNAHNNVAYLKETDDQKFSYTTMLPESAIWQLEGMDKDLTTKKNYFAVAPSEFIGPDNDGYYWTTLRVCFNMKYDTNEITPFIVTAANATDGTMVLTEVTGDIIPEKTCVLLRCNSADVTRNVMIPTTQAATFDAEAAGNLLESSEYYYKDQSVNANMNLKGIKLVDGYIGFGGDTKTKVDGNRAYLPIGGDVSVVAPVPNITLADLLESDDTENTYSVTDLTCVYARDNVLYCKDDDGARNRSEMEDGEIDYLVTVAGLQTKPWDQSNWVAVKLPSEAGSGYLDHRLTKVVGRLTNTVNPEFEVTVAPSIGDENPYDENNYITCNFSGSHQANVTINNVEHNYYFVEPKPMEIANVKWALWNGETFSKPSNASSDLMGNFAADFSFTGVPQSTGVYNFPALIKIAPTAQGIMPRAQDEATTSWLVFPLELTNQPVTAIDSLQSGKTTVKVVYYNLMGVESAVPHNGVNIVETRYSDGTRATTKIIR